MHRPRRPKRRRHIYLTTAAALRRQSTVAQTMRHRWFLPAAPDGAMFPENRLPRAPETRPNDHRRAKPDRAGKREALRTVGCRAAGHLPPQSRRFLAKGRLPEAEVQNATTAN